MSKVANGFFFPLAAIVKMSHRCHGPAGGLWSPKSSRSTTEDAANTFGATGGYDLRQKIPKPHDPLNGTKTKNGRHFFPLKKFLDTKKNGK
jgi:hypothetical protein